MDTLLDILKYTLPALVVLIATAIIVNKFLVTEVRKKQMLIYQEGLHMTLRLRLQAYERLTVLLERLHPRSIIPRLYRHGMTVQELQYALIQTIKQEFEHNLSQQIYVSSHVWQTIVGIKEQEMAMVNRISETLNPEASARELHKRILDYILKSDEEKLPISIGLEMIQKEAKMVLSQKV